MTGVEAAVAIGLAIAAALAGIIGFALIYWGVSVLSEEDNETEEASWPSRSTSN